MTARITTVKAKGTKQERAQVHVELMYQGVETELRMLSGGEYDRVVLAFTLAIMELYESPLVLLDECVSSLDAVTAQRVCGHLNEESVSRITVLVAHQLVSGMFDNTMVIE
jgi:ABC-type transport system involved in cytochrome bd biosynthesis fused ATPase/permease subunit